VRVAKKKRHAFGLDASSLVEEFIRGKKLGVVVGHDAERGR
jgi:hypothetical protein